MQPSQPSSSGVQWDLPALNLNVWREMRELDDDGTASATGELYASLLQSHQLHIHELVKLDLASQHQTLRKLAHAMRGASESLGLDVIASITRCLESSPESTSACADLIQALPNELERARAAIARVREEEGLPPLQSPQG